MNKLVLHHTYAYGMTFDVSDNRNHGIPMDVQAREPDEPNPGNRFHRFEFRSGESRIDVLPSESLQNLGAIRTSVRFRFTPPDEDRRLNLIEGHKSFALFINPDGSLGGTILDTSSADGEWKGTTSSPGTVEQDRWLQAELVHDGVNRCQVFLGGTLVGEAADVHGPVRSVGPNGISIGHWPEPDIRYTFLGDIAETKLYKYDPKTEVRDLLDPCCLDRKALDTTMQQLRSQGWNAQKLTDLAQQFLNLATDIAIEVRADDVQETRAHVRNQREAVTAFLRHDAAGYRAVVARLARQAQANLEPARSEEVGLQFAELMDQMPLSMDEIMQLAEAVCWDHARIQNPESLIETDT